MDLASFPILWGGEGVLILLEAVVWVGLWGGVSVIGVTSLILFCGMEEAVGANGEEELMGGGSANDWIGGVEIPVVRRAVIDGACVSGAEEAGAVGIAQTRDASVTF